VRRGSEGGDGVPGTGVQEGEGNWLGSFGVEMGCARAGGRRRADQEGAMRRGGAGGA
jgi:hypothetical protein